MKREKSHRFSKFFNRKNNVTYTLVINYFIRHLCAFIMICLRCCTLTFILPRSHSLSPSLPLWSLFAAIKLHLLRVQNLIKSILQHHAPTHTLQKKESAGPESSWLWSRSYFADGCVLFWNKVNAQHAHHIWRVKLIPLAGFAGWLADWLDLIVLLELLTLLCFTFILFVDCLFLYDKWN